MNASFRLRKLFADQELVMAPGAYDGLTARLVEAAGFDAVYMTGAGTSAAKGYPDYGLLTLTEMVDNAATISRSVDLPVISDADTGYGNEINVTRTVREFEGRGVAAIHIEDQVSPKRCGHLEGKEVIAADAYISKIRAAVAARANPDFMIIARTDSRTMMDLDEAVARANRALAAGADMAFIEAVPSMEELAAVPGRVNGPCVLNVVPGGKTPRVSMCDAARLGYRLAIHPGVTVLAAAAAVEAALASLKGAGAEDVATAPPPSSFFSRLGAEQWDRVRDAATGAE